MAKNLWISIIICLRVILLRKFQCFSILTKNCANKNAAKLSQPLFLEFSSAKDHCFNFPSELISSTSFLEKPLSFHGRFLGLFSEGIPGKSIRSVFRISLMSISEVSFRQRYTLQVNHDFKNGGSFSFGR